MIILGTAPRLERNVDREPLARRATDFLCGAGARVVRILMRGHVQHVRVGLEHVLRPVAVVHVVVHDRDPLDALRAGVRGADGNVVVDAEPHGAATFRVMARRPHERECRVVRARS